MTKRKGFKRFKTNSDVELCCLDKIRITKTRQGDRPTASGSYYCRLYAIVAILRSLKWPEIEKII